MEFLELLNKIFLKDGGWLTILSGLWVTVQISALSLVFGTLFGSLLCFFRVGKFKPLKVAAQIQSSMMPQDMANHESYEVSASMTPAKNVGGDYYDFFPIDEDHVAFTIADVSGKGVHFA